ncbi:MAG: single-stranded DNA-specific DHH superfamily exonuclease [Enterobacterales bacterium]|jgi:single-stranded DNA-specific DHH superfamily exonuclease
MTRFDVFNGDADGICALLQLRLASPQASQLITGVKRDINLLSKVSAKEGDQVTILDVSLDKNRSGLEQALSNGAEVFYVDHHFAGEIPEHDNLTTIINTTSDVCTSILVNKHLKGQFIEWAIVGAFGDNLKNSARSLCKSIDLSESEITALENLGVYINYNGYGASLDDLHFTPIELYQCLLNYKNPLDFIKSDSDDFNKLESGYHQDMATAAAVKAELVTDNIAIFILSNETWARRVSGVYGNDLANKHPDRAHAVLTHKENDSYLVSIRAPLNNKTGADVFCRQFETGGGRSAAAGINVLPAQELEHFIERFNQFYS